MALVKEWRRHVQELFLLNQWFSGCGIFFLGKGFLIGFTSHLPGGIIVYLRGAPHPRISGQDNPTCWLLIGAVADVFLDRSNHSLHSTHSRGASLEIRASQKGKMGQHCAIIFPCEPGISLLV